MGYDATDSVSYISATCDVEHCGMAHNATPCFVLAAAAVTVLSSTRSPDGKCAVYKQQVADEVGADRLPGSAVGLGL